MIWEVLTLLLVFNSYADISCTKKLSKTKYETTHLFESPFVSMFKMSHDCRKKPCDVEDIETLLTDRQVCSERAPVRQCSIVEEGDFQTGYILSVTCSNSSLSFTVQPTGEGKLFCRKNGNLFRTVTLGECTQESARFSE